MTNDDEFNMALSGYLSAPKPSSDLISPNAGSKAFDEGRASAMQKLGMNACPYSSKTEPKSREFWMAGYRSLLGNE